MRNIKYCVFLRDSHEEVELRLKYNKIYVGEVW